MQAKLTFVGLRWQNCTSIGIALMWLSLLLGSYWAGWAWSALWRACLGGTGGSSEVITTLWGSDST